MHFRRCSGRLCQALLPGVKARELRAAATAEISGFLVIWGALRNPIRCAALLPRSFTYRSIVCGLACKPHSIGATDRTPRPIVDGVLACPLVRRALPLSCGGVRAARRSQRRAVATAGIERRDSRPVASYQRASIWPPVFASHRRWVDATLRDQWLLGRADGCTLRHVREVPRFPRLHRCDESTHDFAPLCTARIRIICRMSYIRASHVFATVNAWLAREKCVAITKSVIFSNRKTYTVMR